jgi:hypothetical protein
MSLEQRSAASFLGQFIHVATVLLVRLTTKKWSLVCYFFRKRQWLHVIRNKSHEASLPQSTRFSLIDSLRSLVQDPGVEESCDSITVGDYI